MGDNDTVRQRIINSVFDRRNAAGQRENYVAHLKIWEDAEDGTQKPRFILLAQTGDGLGVIHKSKLNTNGSFSVGKTWRLTELRAVEVNEATAFTVSLARRYRWQTDNASDQQTFLNTMVRVFRDVTGGNSPLQVVGLSEAGPSSNGSNGTRTPAAPTPQLPTSPAPSRRTPTPARSQTPSRDYDTPSRIASPAPRSQIRATGSRPASPANGLPSRPNRADAASPPPRRAPSPTMSNSGMSISGSVAPRRRRPSNAAPPTSMRTTSAASDVPSINLSSPPPTARPSISTFNLAPSRSSNASNDRLDGRGSLDLPPPSSSSLNRPSPSDYAPSPRAPSPESRSRSPARSPAPPSRKASSQSVNGFGDGSMAPRERNARVSFFDPANQAALDRLISGEEYETGEGDTEGDQEMAQATLASVEEMLEGYEWASDDIMSMRRARGPAEQIESRLLDELMALDKASIHSFLESDDRVGIVLNYLDEAIADLDGMESLLSSYKIHLNAVSDDISYIQSQNRGLQVQTQNQKSLLTELEQLLQTVHVDDEALLILVKESLDKPESIQRLEEAAIQLYKALLAGRDRDMAATMERLGDYKKHNTQFCKRLLDYLSLMFNAQAQMLLGDNDGLTKTSGRGRPGLVPHVDMETYLGRYAGLMLYLKDIEEATYSKICGAYFSAASNLHMKQIKALFDVYSSQVKAADEEDETITGTTATGASGFRAAAGMRRAGTIMRPNKDGRGKDKGQQSDGDMRVSEAFGYILERIAPQIYREDEFLADFLQINDAGLTFADYMSLENYFRRQASRTAGLSSATMKLIRGAMDLIFGFLQGELKVWIDQALAKDSLQIVGIIATLERFLLEADERGNAFLLNVLEKQQGRLKQLFDRHMNEQIKMVEDTKLTSKKRKGVAPFIRNFPGYLARIEAQLVGAETLEIRQNVNGAYDRIVQSMFDCLKQMAKISDEGEDKGQLNYHVILIENMQQFMAEMAQAETRSAAGFSKRAETIYDENLQAYVKLVLRRPFSKIIEYFEGVERLLQTTAPTEVSSNSSYNKSALKKVVKEYDAKDIRKHVDALFKRVEKHFTVEEKAGETAPAKAGPVTPKPTKSSDVLPGVWKACETELLRITDLFNKRIAQCYAGSGVSLEYTASDVQVAFKKHQIGA